MNKPKGAARRRFLLTTTLLTAAVGAAPSCKYSSHTEATIAADAWIKEGGVYTIEKTYDYTERTEWPAERIAELKTRQAREVEDAVIRHEKGMEKCGWRKGRFYNRDSLLSIFSIQTGYGWEVIPSNKNPTQLNPEEFQQQAQKRLECRNRLEKSLATEKREILKEVSTYDETKKQRKSTEWKHIRHCSNEELTRQYLCFESDAKPYQKLTSEAHAGDKVVKRFRY